MAEDPLTIPAIGRFSTKLAADGFDFFIVARHTASNMVYHRGDPIVAQQMLNTIVANSKRVSGDWNDCDIPDVEWKDVGSIRRSAQYLLRNYGFAILLIYCNVFLSPLINIK